jgi:hypothetical protein
MVKSVVESSTVADSTQLEVKSKESKVVDHGGKSIAVQKGGRGRVLMKGLSCYIVGWSSCLSVDASCHLPLLRPTDRDARGGGTAACLHAH